MNELKQVLTNVDALIPHGKFLLLFQVLCHAQTSVAILSEEAPCRADESTASKRSLCCTLKEPRLAVVWEYDLISMGMNTVPTILSFRVL